MISLLVSIAAIIVFAIALWKSGVAQVAKTGISTALTGIAAIMDRDLDDDAKEIAARKAAFSLFRTAFSIAVRFVIILAAAAAPIFLADILNVTDAQSVLALMMRIDYIIIVSIVAVAIVSSARYIMKKWQVPPAAPQADNAVNSYSGSERILHNMAFSSPAFQRRISNLEDKILGPTRITPKPPIFVTSLARGGTTALLNALTQLEGIATHTYRDMPFLTAPILWDRLAGSSRRKVATRSRAHGDGLTIDLDTAEAFEEIIWKMHWTQKYGSHAIELWSQKDRDSEAEQFLSNHMLKIMRARFGKVPSLPVRYCSKNNANIGRLEYLPEAFPNCAIIVPLRHPARHASSLHRQHLNFLKLQKEDDFVKRYMSDIGHFEFGQIYTPLNFPGLDSTLYDANDPNHWLNYWISAFSFVQKRIAAGQDLMFVTQDQLRMEPRATIEKLSDRIKIPMSAKSFDKTFRSKPDIGSDEAYSPALLQKAMEIYDDLSAQAL